MERFLWYKTDDERKEYVVRAGVPQGPILGPMVLNIMYNGVIGLCVLGEATLVEFADDLAVVVIVKYSEDAEIKAWLRMVKLDLADVKT